MSSASTVELQNLSYVFPRTSVVGLQDVSLRLPTSSRTLLIGANGAGKTTLLRVLAGKSLAKSGSVAVGGIDPFREGLQGVTYLGTEWATNPTVRHDVAVPYLLSSVGGDTWTERRDELIRILDIDLRWHMNTVSDGERRRVQLAMGMLRPWTILLLDEVTVDLDVLVRAEFLSFLKRETLQRDCSIVYATHIFDGLADWPTHVAHMAVGRVLNIAPVQEFAQLHAPTSHASNSSLLEMALEWLRQDVEIRGARADAQKLRWEDLAADATLGGVDASKFTDYFKVTRNTQ